MIRLAEPQRLQLLIAIPIYLGVVFFILRFQKQKLRDALGDRMAPLLAATASTRKRWWRVFLRALASFFVVVALARPQLGSSLQEIKSEGIELILAVDVSNSMMSEDVKPSRLEHAKKELARLLDLLSGDKVGIVAFAGSAILVSPITTDKSALKMFLESLSTDTLSTQGTAFDKAIQESVDAFRRGGSSADINEGEDLSDDESAELDKAVSRAIVMASDGEDNEAGALPAAKKAYESYRIRIFTLAFGTEKGAPIPMRDEHGNLTGYKKDSSGSVVLTRTRGEVLRNIAEAAHGAFYHITFAGDQVKSLVSDLNQLEKTKFDAEVSTSYDEKYQIFLLLGLLIILLDMVLSDYRSLGHLWRGRFEVSRGWLWWFLVPLAWLGSSTEASTLSSIYETRSGIESFSKKRLKEGKDHLLKALAADPFSAPANYNLGLAFLAEEDYDRAIRAFQEAERLADQQVEIKFVAAFNRAIAYTASKNIALALDAYQQALSYKPDSLEVRTNIELLFQQNSGGKGDSDDKKDDKQGGQGEQDKPSKDGKSEEEQKKENDNKEAKENRDKNGQQQRREITMRREFKSPDLTEEQVKTFLEELKRQEQSIRAKMQEKQSKEPVNGKDW